MPTYKSNKYVEIKHCVLSLEQESHQSKLWQIVKCYLSDRHTMVIGIDDDNLAQIIDYLFTNGIWAFKLISERINDSQKIYRVPVTTMEFISQNYNNLKLPKVIINFDLNFNRVKFLERFIYYSYNESNQCIIDIFHIGLVNSPETIWLEQFFN